MFRYKRNSGLLYIVYIELNMVQMFLYIEFEMLVHLKKEKNGFELDNMKVSMSILIQMYIGLFTEPKIIIWDNSLKKKINEIISWM